MGGCHCLMLDLRKTSALLSSGVSSTKVARRTPISRCSHRTVGWRLQRDGGFKAVTVPGLTAWAACWRVYKAALLCLGYPVGETSARGVNERLVVTVSALDEYIVAFRAVSQELPEAWHLAIAVEDRCRAEHSRATLLLPLDPL